jgi:hypothetical protein
MAFALLFRGVGSQKSVSFVAARKSGALQRQGYSQSLPALPAPLAVQPKLTMGLHGDRFEQQADRAAAALARAPGGQPRIQETASNSGGRLPENVQSYFEQRLGDDLNDVRVHYDSAAARSAAAFGAQAYTLGRDVVFGAGQYAPHTAEGRQLLAHELTHVVQQRRDAAAPRLQPRLKVWGKDKDISAFLSLLEPASGFTLERDSKTGQVTIKASVLKPPSARVASELMTIITDPDQDAEIHVGRTAEGVHFGAFPDVPIPQKGVPKGLIQEVRIDHALAFEKGAPGSGVALLVHEIIENYGAHDPAVLKTVRRTGDVFHELHARALKAEDVITAELGHPGPRHNEFQVLMGKKPRQFLQGIVDHETFFLVYQVPFGRGKGEISNVRRVPRIRVSTYVINLKASQHRLPDYAMAVLEKAAADMQKNPTASARIEGLMDILDSRTGSLQQAEYWASTAAFYLGQDLRNITPDTSMPVRDRIDSVAHFTNNGSKVVITIDRPDM